jgi:hypothetical protein
MASWLPVSGSGRAEQQPGHPRSDSFAVHAAELRQGGPQTRVAGHEHQCPHSGEIAGRHPSQKSPQWPPRLMFRLGMRLSRRGSCGLGSAALELREW